MIVLRNLSRTPGRTLLTLLGASVGIAVFVALTSIGAQVRSGLQSVIGRYEGDVVVQTLRAATPPGSRIPFDDAVRLGALDGVETATPVVVGSVRTPRNPFFLLFGAPPEIFHRFGLTRGRAYSDGAAELVLGEVAFRALGARVGDTLSIAGRKFLLVGTYDTGAAMLDGGAVTHLAAAQEVLDQPGFVNLVLLRVGPRSSPDSVSAAVRREFPRYRATRGRALVGQLQILRSVDVFARAVSLAALLASCLVVANTLLMAVRERTREIGILRAVGWSKGLILRTLLAESVVLSVLSGLLGNLLALFFLRAVERTGSMGFGWIPAVIPWDVFGASLLISMVLGVAGALYPAVVCAALSPAQALRCE